MSSNASSSGIESDIDSSPNLQEEKDQQSMSDSSDPNDESIDTLMEENDNEGFTGTKQTNSMLDKKNLLLPHQSITSKSIPKNPSHYPHSTRNPYDDDTTSSSVVEDWDEECQVSEPFHFPSYIRRAQWPNHWRWTPPLGLRRTCTQQLHRNLGFEPSGLYDDPDSCSPNINFRRFRFDF